jgi:hypothetical protein
MRTNKYVRIRRILRIIESILQIVAALLAIISKWL